MLISVAIPDGELRVERFTAKVSDGGFMRFHRYDVLHRKSARHQWSLVCIWERGQVNCPARYDGVPTIPRPPLPASVKAQLLKVLARK